MGYEWCSVQSAITGKGKDDDEDTEILGLGL